MARRPYAELAAAVIAVLALAGCGGATTPAKPVAERICDGARAAADRNGAASVSIQSRPAVNVMCTVTAGRARVQIISQAVPQSWTEFDTTSSHQSQVYGPGPGVHNASRTPLAITVAGAVAAIWVPGQSQLIATSGTPTRQGGAYVVVTVSHLPVASAKELAVSVGKAVFAARPAS